MPKDNQEVQLAEEGTPLAEFQKARTDAMSRMFDRDEMCNQIHTTSQLYSELDQAFTKILTTYGNARVEEIIKTVQEMREDCRNDGGIQFLSTYDEIIKAIKK